MNGPKIESVHDGYRRRMIRYLLGEIPEAERDHLEDKVFSDEAFFAELQLVEDKLIDDYVFGGMNPAERQKFETGYLTSERRRQKVRFAQELQQSLASFSMFEPPQQPKRRWQFSILSALRPAWQFGIVTGALLLLMTVTWFIFRPRARSLPVLVASQPTSASPTRSIAVATSPMASPAASAVARTEPSAPKTAAKSIKGKTLLSVLSPGLFRDAGATDKSSIVLLTPQTTTLRLQLKYQPSHSYSEYRVTIETVSGKTILRRDNLKPVPQSSVLSLEIPTNLLAADDYVVLLSGKKSKQVYEELYDYNLRIRTR